MKPKDFVVALVALGCLVAALVLQPWSELQFGFDLKAIPEWSRALVQSPPMSDLKPLGDWAEQSLKAGGASTNFGDYMYALVMFGVLTLIGIAYIAVGREEAEEKLILPVKK
ncbi:MAG: hypothetical protein P4L53_01840 [Candidatus Obscuribacterales bacterium]|nr:hypothetical protein [Candidatus Obscuribacterales bacterium]